MKRLICIKLKRDVKAGYFSRSWAVDLSIKLGNYFINYIEIFLWCDRKLCSRINTHAISLRKAKMGKVVFR